MVTSVIVPNTAGVLHLFIIFRICIFKAIRRLKRIHKLRGVYPITIQAMCDFFQALDPIGIRLFALLQGLVLVPLENGHELTVSQHFVNLSHAEETTQVKYVVVVFVLPEDPEKGRFGRAFRDGRVDRFVLVAEDHLRGFYLFSADCSRQN